jgi:hypothetical protein
MFKKRLNLALWVLAMWWGSGQVKAGHVLGGTLTYEYVGNQTGVANQYRVILSIERELTGLPITGGIPVVMKSPSCGITNNLTLTQFGQEYINTASGQFACLPMQNVTASPRTIKFSAVVQVPPGCPDVKFSFELCCRPGGINSLVSSSIQGTYIEAELNTSLGFNTSPVVTGVPNIFQCVNNTVQIPQTAVEPDGDLLSYELISARQEANLPAQYSFGYTPLNPISSAVGSPLVLHPATGMLELTASTAHKAVVTIRVNEHRVNPATGVMEKVGSVMREVFAEFVNNCPSATSPLQLDTAAGWAPNAAGVLERSLDCGDTSVRLPLAVHVACGSFSPSDLRLVSTTGTILPIKKTLDSCAGGTTPYAELVFHGGLVEGTYYVTVGPMDASPVVTFCSSSIDTIGVLVVGACAPTAVISCPGVPVCSTALTTSGPFTYYSSWSDTSLGGVPSHTSHWTLTNGSILTPTSGDTIEVDWMNGLGTLVLETRFGFCTEYDTLHVDQTVGLSEPRRLELKLRPNPAEDEVWLSGVPPESEVTVYNAWGQPVLRPAKSDGGELRLYVAELPRGTYWVSVHSATGRGQIPMIKL